MTVQIAITENVRLTADASSCTIERRAVTKSGKNVGAETWLPLGYHGTIKAAAESLLERHLLTLEVSDEVTSDLKALISSIDRGAALIAEAVDRRASSWA